jgi:CYTH domain-containing protein/predicted ATPase
MDTDVPKIVLTGGPCAGKTTAISEMSTWARETGYLPIIVPEAATFLMAAGLDPRDLNFQPAVLAHVVNTEASLEKYAQALMAKGHRPVLICDRGLWDQSAYMDVDEFRELCRLHDVQADKAKGDRYDGVIFMRSAAVGAERFYSSESNERRYESLAEAKVLDERTLHAWAGVSHLGIVDNRTDQTFEQKIRRTVAEFSRVLGIPEPMEIERKFDVHDFAEDQLPKHSVKSEIVQNYLLGEPGVTERVRARSYGGQWVFTHTIKQFVSSGVAVERERIVSKVQYEDLLVRVDRVRETIRKFRHCFLYGNHHYELDVFLSGKRRGQAMLEVEVGSLEDEIVLPSFLSLGDERTNDPSATNFAMAG